MDEQSTTELKIAARVSQENYLDLPLPTGSFDIEGGDNLEVDWLNRLVETGLPRDAEALHRTAVDLQSALGAEWRGEEEIAFEAYDLVKQGIARYEATYLELVTATVDQAKKIIARYPGVCQKEGKSIIDVTAEFDETGHARLVFETS